jgi:hypothetical protein
MSDAKINTAANGEPVHWRCFHCGDTFGISQERWAREHFGRRECDEPVCLIRSAGEGAILTALRNAQEELDRYRAEDSDLMRVLYAMGGDHQTALRQAEEDGYAKGLRDARAELLDQRPAVRDPAPAYITEPA